MAISITCQESPEEVQPMLLGLLRHSSLVLGWPGRWPELPSYSGAGAAWKSARSLAGVRHQLLAVCFSYPPCCGSAGKTLQRALGLAAFWTSLLRGIIWNNKEETVSDSLFSLGDRNKFFMRIVGEIPWEIEGFDRGLNEITRIPQRDLFWS